MPSRRFGKYEVIARLATGGAANIFLARQPGVADFHKLVCLKTLLPERSEDADFVAMFLDEARLAARLNHPNCVQIYDLGRVRGSYYISMEYIFGETLWNLLATVTKLRTPLPAAHVAAIIASVCDGLHHAHELKDSNGRPFNLVHRDVSPQNVMISFEGQTKVVDFGIAKAETGRVPTMAGIVKGKFSYMSPEQITGGQIDRRSDIYSLGIVLFECLASRRLYRGDTPEDIARLILEHRAPRLRDVVPDIPQALDEICATALARHPSKRYETAQDMGEAIRDYLDSVRYIHSAASLSRLVEERFKGQIPERRKVYEAALAGTHDEATLYKVLDAHAPRDIDLFPEADSPAATIGDFVEPSQAIEVASGLMARAEPTSVDTEAEPNDTLDGEEATGDLARPVLSGGFEPVLAEAPGWRVELVGSDVGPAPISVLTDADLSAEQTYEAATRIEPEDAPLPVGGAPELVTNVDLAVETELPPAATGVSRVPTDDPTSVELLPPPSAVRPAKVPADQTFLDPTDQLEVEPFPRGRSDGGAPSGPTGPVDASGALRSASNGRGLDDGGLAQATAPMSGARSP
ncbi:protein kinase, partial [Myxococcota bacterium]|nr:protein kinase [Myxococcota bacterium]